MNLIEEGKKLYESLLDDDSATDLTLIGDYPFLTALAEGIEEVHNKLRESKLYTLWLLYIDLVDILLMNSTAERTGWHPVSALFKEW